MCYPFSVFDKCFIFYINALINSIVCIETKHQIIFTILALLLISCAVLFLCDF